MGVSAALTTSRTGQRSSRQQQPEGPAFRMKAPADPKSLPKNVKLDEASQWVVSYERVISKRIPASSLFPFSVEAEVGRPSTLLMDYLRVTHVAFSWTPQAILIRSLVKEPHVKRSFDTDWISFLNFGHDDLVNGVYRVSHHSKEAGSILERLELLIEVPGPYKGSPVRGLLVTAIEPSSASNSDEIVFVNETWMWRGAEDPPTNARIPSRQMVPQKASRLAYPQGAGSHFHPKVQVKLIEKSRSRSHFLLVFFLLIQTRLLCCAVFVKSASAMTRRAEFSACPKHTRALAK